MGGKTRPQQAAGRVPMPQADVVEGRVELELAEFDADHVLLRDVVVRADDGVIARVAGARGDRGTGIGATALTGGRLARRPEIRRVASDPDPDIGFDAIQREVEFDPDVQSPGAHVRSESSVLERSRSRGRARGRIDPVPGAEEAELEREERQKSETASRDQAPAPPLASQRLP